jgi:hypothetical protein
MVTHKENCRRRDKARASEVFKEAAE